MATRLQVIGLAAGLVWLLHAGTAAGQYSSIAAQRNGASHSFFENIGIGFGAQFGNGGFFNFGGPAPPPFGGGNDGGGARFGFGGPNFGINIYADQGASSTITSTSARVTVPNGGTGSIFSGSISPFVTGIVPIVGQTSPVLERYHRLMQEGGFQEYVKREGLLPEENASAEPDSGESLRLAPSSAARGDYSIAEIRRQQAVEDRALQEEMLQLVAKADRCISEGKLGAARVYLQQAARRAEGSQREAILAKFDSINR